MSWKTRTHVIAIVLGLLLSCSLAAAKPVELNAIQFPERRSVKVLFDRFESAPRATLEAEVTYRDGQAWIEVSYDSMKPAILFAGDVTCYVLWAVTRDGTTENLGELLVTEPDGKLEFATGKKSFALAVTAEPFYLVGRPSELLMFRNAPSREKKAPSSTFQFSGWGPAPNHAMESIANIAWDADTPLTLLQARKAYELATRNDASVHAAQVYQEAGQALKRANEQATKSGGKRKLLDDARRAVALSNEAINISLHRIEGIELEKRIEERRAEMEALETRAAEAEANARRSEELVAAARDDMERVRTEKDRMSVETAALKREKSDLEAGMVELRQAKARLQQEKTELNVRLQDALSHVAETRDTARGFVVNLPDILFDIDEATLKPEARVVLAKLAGILLVIPDLTVTVEGHTDSTGSAEYNLQLSKLRAESVQAFLGGQGVAPERLSAVGFGMERPIADNATAEGRKRNRRVEIVIAEGP
jgi:outer membrane protein OmpA-like peptidoglycan-associated protein